MCEFCTKDWGIPDPETNRFWQQSINYCPNCGRPLRHTPTPEALSLEQLAERVRNGEPYYYVDLNGNMPDEWRLEGKYIRAIGGLDNYGKTWLAYTTKPAKEGEG